MEHDCMINTREKLIIVGISTAAREITEFINYHRLFEIIGYAVNSAYLKIKEFQGKPVFALEDLEKNYAEDYKLFVAVQWNKLNRDRKNLYYYCKTHGFKLANVISPTAIIRSQIKTDNLFIDDNVIIKNNVKLGNNCYLKASCICGPNTIISDNCFLGLNSIIGGGCIIGEQSFIGLNATVFDCTTVGRKCLIGACAVVKRNMPDFSKCVTSSANMVIKQYGEDEIEEKLVASKNVR